jgi:hypothetical protein
VTKKGVADSSTSRSSSTSRYLTIFGILITL